MHLIDLQYANPNRSPVGSIYAIWYSHLLIVVSFHTDRKMLSLHFQNSSFSTFWRELHWGSIFGHYLCCLPSHSVVYLLPCVQSWSHWFLSFFTSDNRQDHGVQNQCHHSSSEPQQPLLVSLSPPWSVSQYLDMCHGSRWSGSCWQGFGKTLGCNTPCGCACPSFQAAIVLSRAAPCNWLWRQWSFLPHLLTTGHQQS